MGCATPWIVVSQEAGVEFFVWGMLLFGAIGTTLLIYANHLRIRYRREGIALGTLGVGLIVFGVAFVVAWMLRKLAGG